MSVNLDNICFYQPPTPVVNHRASKNKENRSISKRLSVMGEVPIQFATASSTFHGVTSPTIDPVDLTSEVRVGPVGNILENRDSTSSSIVGDVGLDRLSSVPVNEPTTSDTMVESMAAGTSVAHSLIRVPNVTAFQPLVLTEASDNLLPESGFTGEIEPYMAGSGQIDDHAAFTPETTLETQSENATSPSRREQQIDLSSGPPRSALPAWLESCRSPRTSNKQTPQGSGNVMAASRMSGFIMQSTEDGSIFRALSPSTSTPSRQRRYSVTLADIGRPVPGQTTPETIGVSVVDQHLGSSTAEAEPESAAEPSSTSRASSTAPQGVDDFEDAALISPTAPPSPTPSTSSFPSPARSTPALRRSCRVKAPIGGYAEIESDAESNVNERPDMSPDEDRPFGRRNHHSDSSGQLGHKRRNTCLHEDSVRDTRASKRFRRSQRTSNHTPKSKRQSQQIAEYMKEIGGVSPPQSENASHENILATFDEFSVPDAPLANLVFKRVVEAEKVTISMQFEDASICHRCRNPLQVLQPSSPSLPEAGLSRSPRRRKPRFSEAEDRLLRHLKKEENLSWKGIHREFSRRFQGRSMQTLQVHYSTKLNH
ncbi:hypothetical protein CABS01_15081 [Colletotrichum abscissum]|uniref:Myb-like domain-containing protein n=1 Tax=Colletotrichum abscissum TaxID=1671311 RepID=A0A9Q0B0V1_9PEZI|nr:uncharacterized protein CABS01_15081 [Colletotrichum abscissum]KAI3538377.1 hypothetical protein CABS02_11833 [Colletotrichum abscissum]KAK1477040.1 hypothetical protein CABS01_15081 [Colletotrichum abscissum]